MLCQPYIHFSECHEQATMRKQKNMNTYGMLLLQREHRTSASCLCIKLLAMYSPKVRLIQKIRLNRIHLRIQLRRYKEYFQ